ncbi:MAG: 2-amino-4-hydroxy-6-hydroxymethyldihydropteridine diphosphokinase [Thermoleophilaceae bacterium]|nr:2-amino-4-hydroxy-6-hydroxymethyldihydropteridine diphosphokinase [Thermoleophilaceae bacterium]
MSSERTGYVGLGSNVGDRLENLRSACRLLEQRGVRISARSGVYETAPQGEILDQPDFLNAVVAVETDAAPLELLATCKTVEAEWGREMDGPRHGPRVLDLDVLALGRETWSDERMTLPHPEILSRRFVLEPLLELAPELVLPDGRRAADGLSAVADQSVIRVTTL